MEDNMAEQGEYRVITFRVRMPIYDELKKIADVNHRSVGGQVTLYVEKGIEDGKDR